MENEHTHSQQFTVGSWVVRPELDRIERSGQRISLEPRAMDILVYLAQHAGEVISTDELISEVWAGQIVGDNTVYQWIHKLRNALGDDSHDPSYIDTITKKGYRLIAHVETVDLQNKAARTRLRRQLVVALSVVVVLALSIAVFRYFPQDVSTATGDQTDNIAIIERHSIAVLPFRDLSPDGDQEYFAHGVTEEILDVISGIPELMVVGRSSSFRFLDRNADLREIGQQLGVDHLLKGSIRRVGDQLRVTAQLIRAEDGVQIWSRDYEKPPGQIFTIQEEIAGNIARKLKLSVVGADAADASSDGKVNVNLEAHDLFLLARQHIHQGDQDNLEEAVVHLEEALSVDPEFARAHAELAYAYIAQANLGGRQIMRMRLDGPAMQHAETALSIAPGLADAHAVRGMVFQIVAAQHNAKASAELRDKAEQEYIKSLESNPNSARTHIWYAGLMRDQGRAWDEVRAQGRRAIELDPLWPFALRFYVSLLEPMADHRQEIWEIIQKLKQLVDEADQDAVILLEADALITEGRLAEAIYKFEALIESGSRYSSAAAAEISWLWTIAGEPNQAPRGEHDEWSIWMMDTLKLSGHDATGIPCPGSEVKKDMHPWNISTCGITLMMGGQTAAASQFLKEALPDGGLDEIDAAFRVTYSWIGNAVISMATIFKLAGENEKAMAYADKCSDWWSVISSNGALASANYSASQAVLHALSGNRKQALLELGKVIDMGDLDFRIFMHPAFNEIRHDPKFRLILEHWMSLINDERAMLSLDPLKLNDDVGPGVPPFNLNKKTS